MDVSAASHYAAMMMVTLGVALGTLVAAEPTMTFVHRFVFHGPLWCEHKSHHEHPTVPRIVRNDLLWVWPLLASAVLISFGGPVRIGLGIGGVFYVAAYILAHDGVAHGRFWVPAFIRHATIFRLVAKTHRLHHRGGRDGVGASPFGVYLAHLEYRWGLNARYRAPMKVCSPSRRHAGP